MCPDTTGAPSPPAASLGPGQGPEPQNHPCPGLRGGGGGGQPAPLPTLSPNSTAPGYRGKGVIRPHSAHQPWPAQPPGSARAPPARCWDTTGLGSST